MALTEAELEDFFRGDVEYLPDARFETFSHAPLARRLKVHDFVEWTTPAKNGGVRRFRGTITRIVCGRRDVNEMDSWDLRRFKLTIKAEGAWTYQLTPSHGHIRLAPKQQ